MSRPARKPGTTELLPRTDRHNISLFSYPHSGEKVSGTWQCCGAAPIRCALSFMRDDRCGPRATAHTGDTRTTRPWCDPGWQVVYRPHTQWHGILSRSARNQAATQGRHAAGRRRHPGAKVECAAACHNPCTGRWRDGASTGWLRPTSVSCRQRRNNGRPRSTDRHTPPACGRPDPAAREHTEPSPACSTAPTRTAG